MKRRSWIHAMLAVSVVVTLAVLLLPGLKQRLAAGVTAELDRKFARDALSSSPLAARNYFTGCEILPLCEAIQGGDRDRVAAILDSGIDLDEASGAGLTALVWALVWAKDEFVAELLRRGASPDVVLVEPVEVGRVYLEDGDTFPLSAIKLMRFDMLFLSLGFTADPSHKDRFGFTVLGYYLGIVSRRKHGEPSDHTIARIEQIIRAGVDVNNRDLRGDTILHEFLPSKPGFALVLLERGADPMIENNKGISSLQLLVESLDDAPQARKLEFQPVVDWLTDRGLL